ncbi:MAG: LamG-like jellyroll fold domain-containing protein, partial [Alphaproteobacteria bacterium]
FDPLSDQILAENPVAYYRLNESGGGVAANLGSIGTNATYENGATLGADALYAEGDQSAEFNGINQGVAVPDSPLINTTSHAQRTVELVFNANDTSGRQVLYEEGATVNAFAIYIEDGELYINGRDAGAWGPGIISTPIQAGETYHVAFTFDYTGENRFTGFLNGNPIGFFDTNAVFPSHSGDIGIGFMNDGAWYHNNAQGGDGNYFNGRISDVAIYNDRLSDSTLYNHASSVLGNRPIDRDKEFELILDQIDRIAFDSRYKGINLLMNNDLITSVNNDGTSSIVTQGGLMTSAGLEIQRDGFSDERELPRIIDSIDDAIRKVRAFRHKIAIDNTLLTTREEFTLQTANTLKAGSDDLTLADLNKEGANLLALDTRSQLGQVSLALAGETTRNILDLFA